MTQNFFITVWWSWFCASTTCHEGTYWESFMQSRPQQQKAMGDQFPAPTTLTLQKQPLDGKLGGPQSWSEYWGKQKLCKELNAGCPAHSHLCFQFSINLWELQDTQRISVPSLSQNSLTRILLEIRGTSISLAYHQIIVTWLTLSLRWELYVHVK